MSGSLSKRGAARFALMDQIEFKNCESEFKLAGEETEPGLLEGYCATWDGPDRRKEIIIKGAFARTLPDFRTAGFLALEHDWKQEIGTIEAADEDDRGLLVRARFYSTPDAQIIRRKLQEKIARGGRPGMSIGYKVDDDSFKSGVRYLKSITLIECSVVSLPCNVAARVASVKSLEFKVWEETENEIRYRVREPEDFDKDSFRRLQLQKSPPVFAIIGHLKGEESTTIQALRFPAESWSLADAKKWVKGHQDSLKSFSDDALRAARFRRLLVDYRLARALAREETR